MTLILLIIITLLIIDLKQIKNHPGSQAKKVDKSKYIFKIRKPTDTMGNERINDCIYMGNNYRN